LCSFFFLTLNNNIIIRQAIEEDKKYADIIVTEMAQSAKARGTGIAKRSAEYIMLKIEENKGVIALTQDGTWVGFCYIEAWEHDKYVANSGLIVSPEFRQSGVAKKIKQKIFEISRQKYPHAKIFGLTTGLAVMKINSTLGYEPVTYSQLTTDEMFWKGCQSCVNHEILIRNNQKNCLCTAMLYDPAMKAPKNDVNASVVNSKKTSKRRSRKLRHFKSNFKLFERWIRYKQYVMLKSWSKKENEVKTKIEKK